MRVIILWRSSRPILTQKHLSQSTTLDTFQTNRVLTRNLTPLERVLTRPGDFFVPFFFPDLLLAKYTPMDFCHNYLQRYT